MTAVAVASAAKELEDAGWLRIKPRPGTSPIYECLTYSEPIEEFEVTDGRRNNGGIERFFRDPIPSQKDCTPSKTLEDTPSKTLEDTPSKTLETKSPIKSPNEKPSSASPPRRPKRDEKEVREFTDYYQDLFMEDYDGAKPTWDGKVMKLVRADISRLGVTLLADLTRMFFEDPGEFVLRNETGKGYNVFHSQIDHLLERRARKIKGCA
jgi:hypothetical protein